MGQDKTVIIEFDAENLASASKIAESIIADIVNEAKDLCFRRYAKYLLFKTLEESDND